MTSEQPELLKPSMLKHRTPRPVAGFWMRTGAFAIDLIFLRFLFYAFVFLGKEYFYAMGSYAVIVGLAVIIGYFLILDGPLGKGKTIGKMLFAIALHDYNVRPLSSDKALIRTAACLNVFIFSVVITSFFGNITSPLQMFLINLFSGFLWAFIIANGILIGVHPLKQGFHDLLARSLITKENLRQGFDALAETIPDLKRLQTSALQSAAIGFVVMVLLSGFMNFRYSFSEPEKQRIQQMKEIREQFAVNGFDLVSFRYGFAPPDFLEKAKQSKGMQEQQSTSPTKQASPTPQDLRYSVILYYRSYHAFDKEDVRTRESISDTMIDAMEWARQNLPELAPSLPGQKADETVEKRLPEKIYFIFEQRINLTFLYQYSEDVSRSFEYNK